MKSKKKGVALKEKVKSKPKVKPKAKSKKEEPLNRTESLRRSLIEQKNTILVSSRQGMKSLLSSKSNEFSADDIDMANSIASDYTTKSRLYAQHETIKKIDSALLRLQKGEYGMCEECGGEIPTRRLEVLPFATLCVPCQEEQEVLARVTNNVEEMLFTEKE